MSHILNLTVKPTTPPVPKKPVVGSWDSPVGWWEVCTEGDCEGRSTATFGPYYGHVAEILFGIKENQCYGYWVKPVKMRAPRKRPTYTVARTKANIAMTFFPSKLQSATALLEWLDAPALGHDKCNYYNSFTLLLLDKEVTDQVKRQKALAKLNAEDRKALGV